jgi:hypothetical protein
VLCKKKREAALQRPEFIGHNRRIYRSSKFASILDDTHVAVISAVQFLNICHTLILLDFTRACVRAAAKKSEAEKSRP